MTEIDPRLVRLVARHFNDLHGLRTATWGIVLAVGDWVWLATASEPVTFVAAVASFIAALFLFALTGEEQYRQLGRVPLTNRQRSIRAWMAVPFVIFLNAQRSLPVSAPSLVWLAVSLYFLWLAIDGWPWRWYHLLAWAPAVYLALAWPSVPQPRDPIDFGWMAPRLWVFALALVATGIADHCLLLRAMRLTSFDVEAVSQDADTI